jgi:hypothetical protein
MIVPIGLSNAANATTDMIPACLLVIVLFLPLLDQMGRHPFGVALFIAHSMSSFTFLVSTALGIL